MAGEKLTGNSSYRLWWCWDPDNQEEASGEWIEETHARYAAEHFARLRNEREAENYRDGGSVSVRSDDLADEAQHFEISVDWSPSFYASEDPQ